MARRAWASLYIRKGVKLVPFMDGGAQEKNRRAGTASNVPGIVGMGEAAQLAAENMETTMAKVAAVRDHLIARIEAEIPYAKLNGHRTNRLPGNVNFCFRFIEGESMLMLLDAQGHLRVKRLGLHQRLAGSVARAAGHRLPARDRARFAAPVLSEETTTMADADFVVDQLKEIIRACGACPRSTRILLLSRKRSKFRGVMRLCGIPKK